VCILNYMTQFWPGRLQPNDVIACKLMFQPLKTKNLNAGIVSTNGMGKSLNKDWKDLAK